MNFVTLPTLALLSAVFAWGPSGVQLADQYTYGVAGPVADGAGGAFLSYWDFRRDFPLGNQVHLARVSVDGSRAPGWASDALVENSNGSMFPEAVVPDGLGGAYVALSAGEGGSGQNVLLNRISATGVPAPGWPDTGRVIAGRPFDEVFGGLCSDGAGGVFIGWQNLYHPFADWRLQRRFADGSIAPGWPDTGVVLMQVPFATKLYELIPDQAGGCYAVISDPSRKYVQHVTATGAIAPGWPPEGLPYCNVASNQFAFEGISDGAGGLIVTWDDDRAAPPNPDPFTPYGDIYAQRFRPDGTHPAGWPDEGLAVCVAPGSAHWFPRLCPDGAGGAVIAWSNRQPAWTMGVQRITASGQVALGWPANGRAVGDRTSAGAEAKLASDGEGGAYIAWVANDAAQQYFDFAQHVLGDGTIAPGWPFPAAQISPSDANSPILQLASSGNAAVVLWFQAIPADLPRSGLWAQRFVADGLVPTQIALRDVHATGTQVSLTWWGANAGQVDLVVQRSEDGLVWSPLGPPQSHGPDAVEYQDGTVIAGRRYGYRLADAHGAILTTPEWVDVPRTSQFALAGAHPNPSPAGRFEVEFSLSERAPGVLELLDIAGRRLAWRELRGLEAGRHLVHFTETSAFAPGIYWLRLRQGTRLANTRVAIVH